MHSDFKRVSAQVQKIEQGKANKVAALRESLTQEIAAETIKLTVMQAGHKTLEERSEKLTEEVLESFKNDIREQEILTYCKMPMIAFFSLRPLR